MKYRQPCATTAIMATYFVGFARLPSELRHKIWQEALPSPDSKSMKSFIKCLAHLILSQPRDTFFGYGVPTKYDGTIINDFMRDNPSPYAEFEACPESRVVAFKHLEKLLDRQKDLVSWLINPNFPYTDLELIVRNRDGKLTYRRTRITDGFDMDGFIFWKFKDESKYNPKSAAKFAANEEYEKWKEVRDLAADEDLKQELKINSLADDDDCEKEFWEEDNAFRW